MIEWWWLIVYYFTIGAVIAWSGRKGGDSIKTTCQVFVFWFVLVVVAAIRR